MGKRKLKPGWQVWRFDQIAVNVNDRIENPSEAGVERYVGLEHLDPESLKIRRWGSPSDVEATKLIFRKGDIIFGRRRAYQRKLAVADFDGICSAHAMVLRARPEVVLPEFLPFFMQSDLFMNRAQEISVGSLSPTINWKTLATQEFALPPLEEQRRMVGLLQSLEGSIEASTALVSKLDNLRKAHILHRFSTLLSDGSARLVKVDEAGEPLMGRQLAPKYQRGPSPRPYLRVANVFDGFLDLSDINKMDFSDKEFEQYRLKPGDVLLVEGHSSADVVGRSAIFRGEMPNACFQNTLIRFRSKSVSPEFAHQYFRYCLLMGKFSKVAKQTTIAHLGVSRFAKMEFPLPDRNTEQKVVGEFDEIEFALLDASKRQISAKSLKQSLFESLFVNQ